MAYVAPKTLARARQLRKRLTEAEAILWVRLRALPGIRFRRQHPVGPYIADFACTRARLIVELDGATHGTEEERSYDAHRDAFLRSRGWRVLRIPNVDVYGCSDEVASMIGDLAGIRIRAKMWGGF
jgi:very-short-patch-repair endonuclease